MQHDEKWWNERLDPNAPERVQKAIKRVYSSYPLECLPKGLCDPMYIINVIGKELGISDGRGRWDMSYLDDNGSKGERA